MKKQIIDFIKVMASSTVLSVIAAFFVGFFIKLIWVAFSFGFHLLW